jgi:hypothetical protein
MQQCYSKTLPTPEYVHETPRARETTVVGAEDGSIVDSFTPTVAVDPAPQRTSAGSAPATAASTPSAAKTSAPSQPTGRRRMLLRPPKPSRRRLQLHHEAHWSQLASRPSRPKYIDDAGRRRYVPGRRREEQAAGLAQEPRRIPARISQEKTPPRPMSSPRTTTFSELDRYRQV